LVINRQHPGFFAPPVIVTPAALSAPAQAPRPKVQAKLSYKDQRRLEELDKRLAALPGEIAALEGKLDDAGLYARDPKGFERVMSSLTARREELEAAELEWLELEEKKDALAGG